MKTFTLFMLFMPISLLAQDKPFMKADQLMLTGMVSAGANSQNSGSSVRLDVQRLLKLKGLGAGISTDYAGSTSQGNVKYIYLTAGPVLSYHLDLKKRVYPFIQAAYQLSVESAEYPDENYEDQRNTNGFYRVDTGALIRLSKRTGVSIEVSSEEFKNVQLRVGFTGILL